MCRAPVRLGRIVWRAVCLLRPAAGGWGGGFIIAGFMRRKPPQDICDADVVTRSRDAPLLHGIRHLVNASARHITLAPPPPTRYLRDTFRPAPGRGSLSFVLEPVETCERPF